MIETRENKTEMPEQSERKISTAGFDEKLTQGQGQHQRAEQKPNESWPKSKQQGDEQRADTVKSEKY